MGDKVVVSLGEWLGLPNRDVAFSASRSNTSTKEPEISIPQWPGPPDPAAFYGLAGDMTRAIEPHTEADPVALLIQALAIFGNIIGRSAHFVAEASCHYSNLFVVLVGRTAKGRKGSSLEQTLKPVFSCSTINNLRAVVSFMFCPVLSALLAGLLSYLVLLIACFSTFKITAD
jgi:hypothetical protein